MIVKDVANSVEMKNVICNTLCRLMSLYSNFVINEQNFQ